MKKQCSKKHKKYDYVKPSLVKVTAADLKAEVLSPEEAIYMGAFAFALTSAGTDCCG